MNKIDRKKTQVDRKTEKLLRRFRWHRWFCRFFGHRQSYHLQIMEEIADELDEQLDDLCAQEGESQ